MSKCQLPYSFLFDSSPCCRFSLILIDFSSEWLTVSKIKKTYFCSVVTFLSVSDQRVKGWFLMGSPLPTLCICLSYVYLVKVLGPKLMENRKPFELKRVLIYYNLFQVVFSSWLFYEVACGVAASSPWFYLWRRPVFCVFRPQCPGGSTTTASNVSQSTIRCPHWLCGWVLHFGSRFLVCLAIVWFLQMVHGCWWYYISKFSEFFDTVSFRLGRCFKSAHASTS